MNYKIIHEQEDKILVSDSVCVLCYNGRGQQLTDLAPSVKLFREAAYIVPSKRIQAASFDKAVEKYLRQVEKSYQKE